MARMDEPHAVFRGPSKRLMKFTLLARPKASPPGEWFRPCAFTAVAATLQEAHYLVKTNPQLATYWEFSEAH